MAYGIKDLGCNLAGIRQDTSRLRKHEFWAVRDVSMDIKRGETIGIIGANGSGKTTLLRLIHSIFPPDCGEIHMRGRMGALIALGAGFHPLMTGRENVYLNGAILGLSKAEIGARMEEIVDFSEIGEFLDAPVSTYSSGMKVRLGFAVASQMNPDILIVDEVLAVGDASFRERCADRMRQFTQNGGSVVLVSHNMLTVEELCERVVRLDKGQVREIGAPRDVIANYEAEALDSASAYRQSQLEKTATASDMPIRAVRCCGSDGRDRQEFVFGESLKVLLNYAIDPSMEEHRFVLKIHKCIGQYPIVTAIDSSWCGFDSRAIPRIGILACHIQDPRFSPGLYEISVGIRLRTTTQLGEKWAMRPTRMVTFTVSPGVLRHRLPRIPTAKLVSELAPMVVDSSWQLDSRATGASSVGNSLARARK